MLHSIVELCREYPQVVLFLALAIGYSIGKIKIFGFTLGSTAGCLLAALVLGQMNVSVPPLVKTIAFALFIFAIGYKVGPQFFGALKKDGLNYIWISLVVALVGLASAIIFGKIFGLGRGLTAGLLSGAMTQSSVIGTAEGAISHLTVSSAAKATMTSNVAVAYAITYIFGTAGLVLFMKIVPKMMRIDLKAESRKLEAELSGGKVDPTEENPDLFNWHKRLGLRAYRVENANVAGKTVQELKGMFSVNVAVDRIKRGTEIIEPKLDTVLQSGDIVGIVGRRSEIITGEKILGPEISDKDIEALVGEILRIVVLKKEAVGKTLGEVSDTVGHGCFLRKFTRQGHELPISKNIHLSKCDVLEVAGSKTDVENFTKAVGYPERTTITTDLAMVGLGCMLGTLLGIVSVPIFGIPITLGVGGGVLVSGLVFGWLRAVHPTFGQVPTETQWVFTDLGLNLFIACVGLIAGPRALHALQTTGGTLFFLGVAVTLIPAVAGLLFGKYILRLNPVLLFGAITGAETCTASLNALKEECDSAAPALGYTVCYAFGNVILTIWGTVIVFAM
ncbi:MAG: aspartate-alanine antiporter [Candidatus Tantalella remota]|nr:aspartate-alanine antiporter [Candidatus Tantalella remota]